MHKLEYFLLRFIYSVFSYLPFPVARHFANGLAFIVSRWLPYRKKIIIENMSRIYGEEWPRPQKEFLRETYRHFIYLWIELMQTPKLTPDTFKERIKVKNVEVLQEALAEGKGVLLMSGHLGNFEWINSGISLMRFPFAGITKKQSNPYINKFVTDLREKWGSKIIHTKQGMREGLRFLKNGGILGLAADQYAGPGGVTVNMFGLATKTFAGPAVFHLRTGAPFIFIAAERTAYGRFTFHFERMDCGQYDELNDQNIACIMQCYNDYMEKWIRRFPEQYFWTHRKWKNLSSPESETTG